MCTPPPGQLVPAAAPACSSEISRSVRSVPSFFFSTIGSAPCTTCTAHVFRMHSEQGMFTIAWYDQGVRVVDVAGLADLPTPTVPFVTSGNGNGFLEIGKYVFDDSNTWSFKTNKIASDGSFFGFGNDLGRGFDVYKFDGLGRTVPALVPTELRSGTTAAPASGPAPKQGGTAAQPSQGSGTAAQQPSAATLPTTGGYGPAGGALLLLTALTAGVAVTRRGRRTTA